MDDRSRIFRVRAQHESSPRNADTVFRAPEGSRQEAHAPFDARRLFAQQYLPIRERLSRYQGRLGVLVMAFEDGRGLVAEGWIEASLDRSRSLVIGRHSACNVVLPSGQDDLPLRHVALIARAVSHDEVRIRIVDLHTAIGFADEAGRTLQALTSDGPLFVSLGRVRVAVMITGDPTELPDDPEVAYGWIPERVFLDERGGVFGVVPMRRRAMRSPKGGHASGVTAVRSQEGAISDAVPLCTDDELIAGRLSIFGLGLSIRRDVGERALRRGLLLGRYSRCDVQTGLTSEMVSRVHLLLIQVGDEVLAIDAGSTNGTYKDGEEIWLSRLASGDVLDLGGNGHQRVLWEATAARDSRD